jgi:hypothetical protein
MRKVGKCRTALAGTVGGSLIVQAAHDQSAFFLGAGPGGKLHPQQYLRRLGHGPLDRRLLPVTSGEKKHPRPAGRWLQLEHVHRETPVLPQIRSDLTGAGTDHAGQQELTAGYRGPHRFPLTLGTLLRIDRPGGQNSGDYIGAPLHRPQSASGLFLSGTDDPVIDLHALGRGSGPAQVAQCR